MTALTIDASGLANISPYVLPTGWVAVNDQFKVVSGSLRPKLTATSFSSAIVTSPVSSGVMTVNFTSNLASTDYSDTAGAVFCTPSGVGYYVCLDFDRLKVYAISGGNIGTQIDQSSSLTFASGSAFTATYDLSTNIINTYQDSISTTIPVTTVTGLSAGSGFSNGFGAFWGNVGLGGIITTSATISSGVVAVINNVNSGANNAAIGSTVSVSVSNYSSPVNSGTIDALALTSASSTSVTLPTLVDGATVPRLGNRSLVLTNGTDTASFNIAILSPTGFSSVTLSGTLNTTNTGVLYSFSPAAVVGDFILFPPIPTSGKYTVVDAQGNIDTDYTGTQTFWHISSSTKTARSYSVITGLPSTVIDPTISPNGGVFSGTTVVTLATVTSGATIRYTTDGTSVTSGSTVYTVPISVPTGTVLKVKAFKASFLDSAEQSASFVLATVGGITNITKPITTSIKNTPCSPISSAISVLMWLFRF